MILKLNMLKINKKMIQNVFGNIRIFRDANISPANASLYSSECHRLFARFFFFRYKVFVIILWAPLNPSFSFLLEEEKRKL